MSAYNYPTDGRQSVQNARDGLVVSRRQRDRCTVVELQGDLDMYACPRLTKELEQALESATERLEIDAKGLAFIDSAGLRSVLWARAESQTRNIDFQVTAVSPAVERVIDLAGLRDILLPVA